MCCAIDVCHATANGSTAMPNTTAADNSTTMVGAKASPGSRNDEAEATPVPTWRRSPPSTPPEHEDRAHRQCRQLDRLRRVCSGGRHVPRYVRTANGARAACGHTFTVNA